MIRSIMAEKDVTIARKQIPQDGLQISVPEGKVLTRVHLDMGKDGITLSTIGAASAVLSPGNRQHLILKPAKEGISLAMVGAASAVK
jgi:hypothetical protein